MADNLDLAVRIRADLKSALNNLSRMEKGVRGLGAEMKRSSVTARVFGATLGQLVAGDIIARSFTAIARNARQLAVETVQVGIAAESLADRMKAAFGNAEDAGHALSFVTREANRMGIDLTVAERAFAGLAAATRGTRIEGEATRDIFSAIAEASRAMNLSIEEQSGILRAFEQIISKGIVSAEELRGQLGERLPGVFQASARAMGLTTAEFDKMLRRGNVLAEEFLPRLAAELRRTFGAAAAEAADGPAAAFGRLDNAIVELQRTIAGSGIVDWLANMADQITLIVGAVRRGGEAAGLFDAEDPLNDEDAQIRLRNAQKRYAEAKARLARYEREISAARAVIEEAESSRRILLVNLSRVNDARLLLSEAESLEEALRRNAEIIGRLSRRGAPGRSGLPPPPPRDPRDRDPRGVPVSGSYLDRQRELEAIDKLNEGRRQAEAERVEGIAALRRELAASEAMLAGPYAAERHTIEAERQAQLQRIEDLGIEGDAAQQLRDAIERLTAARLAEVDAASLERLAALSASLASEAASRAGPYEAALHAAEAWRREQEREIEALAAQGHAVEHLGATVDEVYRGMIAAAVKAAADEEAAAADQRLRAATDLRSGIARGLQDLELELNNFAALSENAVIGAFRGMEDALTRFVATGKLQFGDLAQSIIADLARIAIRQSVTLPLFNAISDWWTDAAGGLSYPSGSLKHTGGIVGAPGAYRTGIPAYAFAGAPRLHGGGIPGLQPNEIPTIIERGEGVFTPAQMRALSPAAPEIRIEFINRGTPQRQVEPPTARFDGRQWVIGVVLDDMRTNGPLAQGMQQRFALPSRI